MTVLHVETWGQGDRTAVLVHGLSSSARTWAQLGPALAARGYRVLAPDLRGHGHSPRGCYSRERFADDLRETLPAGPDLAIGHSLGGVLLGMVAEELRPARAVYLDPAWYPWHGAGGFGATQPGIRALRDAGRDDLRAANPRWTDDAVRDRRDELERWDPDTTRMRYLETAAVPVFPVVPSLVVLADPSNVVAPPFAQHLEDVGFALRRVPGAGHFFHLDDPEGTVAALEGWA